MGTVPIKTVTACAVNRARRRPHLERGRFRLPSTSYKISAHIRQIRAMNTQA